MRQNGLFESVRRIFVGFYYRYRRMIDDTWFDKKYGVNTSQIEKAYLRPLDKTDSGDYQFYEAIKSRDFRRMIDSLPIQSPAAFDFVDIGCGKGRGLILASLAKFRSVHGVEISAELADTARDNVRRFAERHNCSTSFHITHSPAEDCEFPNGDIVIFLYNPFVGDSMRAFVDRVSELTTTGNREIYMIYRNPVCHDLISGNRLVDTLHVDAVFAMYRVTRRAIQKSEVDRDWSSSIRLMEKSQVAAQIRNLLRRRRFQAFALGTSKTGSHSIHGMFAQRYRSAHEPNGILLNKAIVDKRNGSLDDRELKKYIRLNDQRRYLEMESNTFNYHFVKAIVELFPSAKFILTYRDPRGWLNSWLNHVINRPERVGSIWADGLRAQYQVEDYSYGLEQELFAQHELFPLSAYLAYWERCNRSVIEAVPRGRLLLIRTEQLSDSVGRIADFLGIESSTLNMSGAHLFKASRNHNLVSQIDADYLADMIDSNCRQTLETLDDILQEQGA